MAEDVNWIETDAFHPPEIPESLGIDPILSALVCALLFIDLSGDNTIDPDDSVTAEETISYYLQRIPRSQIASIQEQLEKLASFAEQNRWDPNAVECIRGFLSNAGLDDDSGDRPAD